MVNERAASFAAVPALTPCRCLSDNGVLLLRGQSTASRPPATNGRNAESHIFLSSFAHCPASLDHDAIEIQGDSTVLKLFLRFSKNFVVRVAAGNVSQHQLLDLARCRKYSGFRRGEMSIVAGCGCVTFKKRGFDNQYVSVTNLFGQSFGSFGIA